MNVFQRFKEFSLPRKEGRKAYNALTKNPLTLIFCLFFLLAAFAFTGCTWGGDAGNLSISISIPKLQQPQSKAPLNNAIKSMTITAYIAGEEDNLKEVGPVTLNDGGTTNFEIDLGIVPAGPATVVIEAIGTDNGQKDPQFFPYYGSTKTVVRPGVNVVNVYMDYGCLVTYTKPEAYEKTTTDIVTQSLQGFSQKSFDAIVKRNLTNKQFVIPEGGTIPAFRMRGLNQPGEEAEATDAEGNTCLLRFMGYAVNTDPDYIWIEDFTAPDAVDYGTGKQGQEMELVGVWYNYDQWIDFDISNIDGTYQVSSLDPSFYTDKLFIPERYRKDVNDDWQPVTFISIKGFEDKDTLVEVHIPASVTAIGDGAFGGCSNLNTVNFLGTSQEWRAINVTDRAWKGGNGIPVPATHVNCTDGTVQLYQQ